VRLFGLALGFSLLILGLTKVVLPAYFSAPTPAQREEALRRAFTTVGLALEQWKAKEGVYPERLEQLVPQHLEAIPLDPWDPGARSLRYVVHKSGTVAVQGAVLLYSVGPDGVDDGGLSRSVGSSVDRVYPVW
jgi:hypothetical protein